MNIPGGNIPISFSMHFSSLGIEEIVFGVSQSRDPKYLDLVGISSYHTLSSISLIVFKIAASGRVQAKY